jgi:mono/diheme cytochrome c family protein
MASMDYLRAGCYALAAFVSLGCGEDKEAIAPPPADPPSPPGTYLQADPQREGDAAAGYGALVNEGYVSCGVPYSVYSLAFGAAPPEERLEGRNAKNTTMAYYSTRFTTASGVEVVGNNCLVCHAGYFDNKIIVGLGSHNFDFTVDVAAQAELVGSFIDDPAEQVEWRKWADRVSALGPYTKPLTVGVNPAENITAVLFAHRDRETLAWSNEPLLTLPPEHVVPVDVPPWWRMKKKNTMFYSGQGRGDHARIMMTASTLCTDSVAEAEHIDSYFPDVRAYIASLEPPSWPFAVDEAQASQGALVFETHCSRCHGSYGAEESYPNLLIALADVGTDPVLAKASTHLSDDFVDWFHGSFYGEIARIEPSEAYVAPPLDGVWATAPYLHNGSVPTIAQLLESAARPQFWRRSFASDDYDQAALGWHHEVLDHGQDGEESLSLKKRIYDTTQLGYSNQGHTFGDILSAAERRALLEYLKTL